MSGRKKHRKLNRTKALQLLLPVMLFISLCVVMCVPVNRSEDDGSEIVAEEAPVTQIMLSLIHI